MNIVEAYQKYKKQFIILISGFSGCGKTYLAKNIERDFKIKRINLTSYYKDDYNQTMEMRSDDGNVNVIDWDNPDAVNWDKFNNDINDLIKQNIGVVVSGFGFYDDKINFTPDIHIHIKISKEKLLDYRDKNIDDQEKNQDIKDQKLQLQILNRMSYPHYLKSIVGEKNAKIHRFINASELDLDKLYDTTFEFIIDRIEKFLYRDKQDKRIDNVSEDNIVDVNIDSRNRLGLRGETNNNFTNKRNTRGFRLHRPRRLSKKSSKKSSKNKSKKS